jgi:hypothetical protein
LFLATVILASSCRYKSSKGYIEVLAPKDGVFEIYRIASQKPLQFVSEQIGHFNQKVELTPGNYLILADCSSKSVVVYPNATKKLVAHQVEFIPPFPPDPNDRFSIQCNRYSQTRSRQHFSNKYSLTVLHGKRELLVGMVPWQIDFEAMDSGESSKTVQYKLSALQVAAFEGMELKTNYYVSPSNGLISITESQEFGRWEMLLPGKYVVEANGTKLNVELNEAEQRVIHPAFLSINVSNDVSLDLSSQITGSPSYVELNNHHWLDLKKRYPLLPGTIKLRLNGSVADKEYELVEGQELNILARSVTVESDCAPWEWSCLGNRQVYLYTNGSSSPFAQGVTDVPLLFLEEDVWLELQGSRNIKYHLPAGQKLNLAMGSVKFVPKPVHIAGQMTDLARVETVGGSFEGASLDLQLDRVVVVPLIVGHYAFAEYVSLADGQRIKSSRAIKIQKGESTEINYSVLLSEKKLQQAKKVAMETKNSQLKTEEKKSLKNYAPVIPHRFQ